MWVYEKWVPGWLGVITMVSATVLGQARIVRWPHANPWPNQGGAACEASACSGSERHWASGAQSASSRFVIHPYHLPVNHPRPAGA